MIKVRKIAYGVVAGMAIGATVMAGVAALGYLLYTIGQHANDQALTLLAIIVCCGVVGGWIAAVRKP